MILRSDGSPHNKIQGLSDQFLGNFKTYNTDKFLSHLKSIPVRISVCDKRGFVQSIYPERKLDVEWFRYKPLTEEEDE